MRGANGVAPNGKRYADEPSGDIVVQSDSAISSQADTKLRPEIYPGQTADLTPVPPAEPASRRDAPATPASFGRYAVRNALWAGGFGAVYLGHDTHSTGPSPSRCSGAAPRCRKPSASGSSRRRAGWPI
jgi:hypothetical protein